MINSTFQSVDLFVEPVTDYIVHDLRPFCIVDCELSCLDCFFVVGLVT
jgi:hypothetical protein